MPQRHAEARRQAASQAAVAMVPTVAAPVAAAPVGRVPFLDDAGQARCQKYLTETAPKAFAVSENGFFGVAVSDISGLKPALDAKERALQSCATFANRACKLYAVDNAVVYRP